MFKAPLFMGLTLAVTLFSTVTTARYAYSNDHGNRYEARNPGMGNGHFPKSRLQRMVRLPEGLTPVQRESALKLLSEAEPRIRTLEERLFTIMAQLRSLSFSEETPQDELITLGNELVKTRDLLLLEIQDMNSRLEKEAGFNPGWGVGRGCGMWRPRESHHSGS